MKRHSVALLLVLGFNLTPAGSSAQEPEPTVPPPADPAFPQPPISAGGALLRSLVVPGWGQSELGAHGRGAFYFFAETFSLFMIARTQIRLDQARRSLPEDASFVKSRKQQREDWIALAVFWALFSAADAWVSVQLFGFEEREGLRPEGVSFIVGWRIPFGP